MKQTERKYKYWHKMIAAHPTKKKEILEAMKSKKLSNVIIDLAYAHTAKPCHRVVYTNLKNGMETWFDVQYLGRVRREAEWLEIKRTLDL